MNKRVLPRLAFSERVYPLLGVLTDWLNVCLMDFMKPLVVFDSGRKGLRSLCRKGLR